MKVNELLHWRMRSRCDCPGPDKTVERFPRTLDLLMQPTTPEGEPYRIAKALPPNAYGIDPTDFYLA